MKIYTCCPHEGCRSFQECLRFLHDWGIEPAIELDDTGHYFEVNIPNDWNKAKRLRFERALSERVSGR